MSVKTIRVAIAGNPNVGKTTILNHLAGTQLKIGNWPGVTVEKKEATLRWGDYTIHLVDLPGIYTLEPISEDEQIAVRFLEEERPDVILNIIELPNFERNAVLTAQLLEFGIPTVIVLNMADEAAKLGIEIDTNRLEELLGVKAVKTVGRTGRGVREILPAIVEAYENNLIPKPVKYGDNTEKVLTRLYDLVPRKNLSKHDLIKILLSDDRYLDLRKSLSALEGRPAYDVIEDERFAFAHGLAAEVIKKKTVRGRDLTDAIDRLVLHPFLGFVVFLGVVYITFKFAFDFSSPFVDWIDGFMSDFLSPAGENLLKLLGFPMWFSRFFGEAIIGGVGFVLTFVPLIASLYFFITLLEMSGYIPRVAFMMDRFMHRIGLHGKSVIPLILGFGCNVPAILATRTMESVRDKMLVIMMIPFMSCPARLVVYAFFIAIFFPENPALIITFLYLLGIAVAVITAFLLRKTIYRGSLSHFVMELPPYRLPSLKTVGNIVFAHVRDFLYRAGTLIFAASVFIWVLLNVPFGVQDPSRSVAGQVGRALVPLFEPIGIDNWKATTSLIPAFLAREIVISSMGTIYTASETRGSGEREEMEFNLVESGIEQAKALGNAFLEAFSSLLTLTITSLQVEEEGEDRLRDLIREDFTPASAMSFMIFILIYTSCLGTFAVMAREIGKKKAIAFLGYSFIVAWLTAFLVYRLLNLFA
jgi:ferrous iron transport protein B